MASLGLDLSPSSCLSSLLTGEEREGPVEAFPPQLDAFRDSHARCDGERWAATTKEPSYIARLSRAKTLYSTIRSEEVEQLLGHTFQEKSFLVQALTHASYSSNQLTESYERLEFLGDAVLDFLVTTHLFTVMGKVNPGKLTDARSALVNNNLLAGLVVDRGLHTFLLNFAPELHHKVGVDRTPL